MARDEFVPPPALSSDLQELMNANNVDTALGVPDFVIAEYLVRCLQNLKTAVARTNRWYGRPSTDGPQYIVKEAGANNG